MATQQTAITQYALVNGVKAAYRRLGKSSGIPLVMMIHFRGNMDFWDPALINRLAKSRPLILFDYPGVGHSEGEMPTTFQGWAAHIVGLVEVLHIKEIDLLGFSMGGAAAQYVALNAPGLVRKLILAGTRTSITPNSTRGPPEIFAALATSTTEEEFKASIALSFFNPSPHGQAAAQASWDRIMSRTMDRAPHLSPELAKRQIESFASNMKPHPRNAFERIHELTMPVFVANGDNDTLIPTINSYELAQILPFAHLHIYPNSGHGFLYQYAELFAKHVDLFLDEKNAVEDAKEVQIFRARLA
ncbi:2-hydroxy-6-oxononadienedioate/2-hydroxy-6-oxononatrienedioate hydrolase 2 [Lachnellula cervina]|uniref:2-hydroxy-6-oxononadienedioate/2-hydroxy-6-oxononatrienedioate hydrolase 2 n=1 Tax=Lachnellula cervina TaxID=1316786 RepID=A0A7D8YU07_9HELO|nr:2-hydroxy-6-oxononadienedioate/2-hydroxy-6-oxononatrienedioate hydrolase 2 [Lachnellula cervina]